jgi:myo-inositol catabolism protein IolS|tara:strand:- start:540 stop:1481 length:942 start_codon:yes stop_codon:yes gene_type:complete
MKNRRLGKTGLMISEVGFGGRSLGGKKENEMNTVFCNLREKDAKNLITNAIKLGINLFETSDSYSSGQSEIRIGEALLDVRENVHIFTKAGTEFLNKEKTLSRTNLSFNYLTNSLDESLTRLQTDYVDVFQTHGIPNVQDVDQIIKTFDKMKSENKARFCGISIGNAISKGLELIEYDFIDCIQLSFSLINRDALKELIPKCHKKNIGVIVNRPLGEGFLGNFTIKQNFSKDDFRSKYSLEKLSKIKKQLESLSFLKYLDMPLSQIALSYILQNDQISTCIPSSNSIQQLIQNVKSTEITLDSKLIDKINSLI